MILFQGSLVAIDKKYTRKCCQKCAVSALPKESVYINTAKGGYLKTTFVCKFCSSESGLHPGLCF